MFTLLTFAAGTGGSAAMVAGVVARPLHLGQLARVVAQLGCDPGLHWQLPFRVPSVPHIDRCMHTHTPSTCSLTPRLNADVAVDINTMTSGTFKASFVRTMLSLHPTLRPLIRLIKAWARKSSLNDPTLGGLNSYCLTLLAISHLQQLAAPLLPPLWQLMQAHPPGATAPLPEPQSDDRPMHSGAVPPEGTAERLSQHAAHWLESHRPAPEAAPGLEDLLMAFFVRLSAVALARWSNWKDSCWRSVSVWYGVTGRCMCQKLRCGKGNRSIDQCCGADAVTGDADWPGMLQLLLATLVRHWPEACAGRRGVLEGAFRRVRRCAEMMLYDDELPAFAAVVEDLRAELCRFSGEGVAAEDAGVGQAPRGMGGRQKPRSGMEGIDAAAMRDVVARIVVAVPWHAHEPMREPPAHAEDQSESGAEDPEGESLGAEGADGVQGDGGRPGSGGAESDEEPEAPGGMGDGADGSAVKQGGGAAKTAPDPGRGLLGGGVRGARGTTSTVAAAEDLLILNLDDDAGDGVGAGMERPELAGQTGVGTEAGGSAAATSQGMVEDVAGRGDAADDGRGHSRGSVPAAGSAQAAAAAALAAAGMHGGEGLPVELRVGNAHAQQQNRVNMVQQRLLDMRSQRMRDWRYQFAVEDPFNEADNAARSMQHMDELLSEALLPVLWGEDALRPLLRRPGRVAAAEHDGHTLRELELSVRQTAAAAAGYDYPIVPGSPLSGHVQRLVAGWMRYVPVVGSLTKDEVTERKLRGLYKTAGGTAEAIEQAQARRRTAPPPPPPQRIQPGHMGDPPGVGRGGTWRQGSGSGRRGGRGVQGGWGGGRVTPASLVDQHMSGGAKRAAGNGHGHAATDLVRSGLHSGSKRWGSAGRGSLQWGAGGQRPVSAKGGSGAVPAPGMHFHPDHLFAALEVGQVLQRADPGGSGHGQVNGAPAAVPPGQEVAMLEEIRAAAQAVAAAQRTAAQDSGLCEAEIGGGGTGYVGKCYRGRAGVGGELGEEAGVGGAARAGAAGTRAYVNDGDSPRNGSHVRPRRTHQAGADVAGSRKPGATHKSGAMHKSAAKGKKGNLAKGMHGGA